MLTPDDLVSLEAVRMVAFAGATRVHAIPKHDAEAVASLAVTAQRVGLLIARHRPDEAAEELFGLIDLAHAMIARTDEAMAEVLSRK